MNAIFDSLDIEAFEVFFYHLLRSHRHLRIPSELLSDDWDESLIFWRDSEFECRSKFFHKKKRLLASLACFFIALVDSRLWKFPLIIRDIVFDLILSLENVEHRSLLVINGIECVLVVLFYNIDHEDRIRIVRLESLLRQESISEDIDWKESTDLKHLFLV